MTAPLQSTSYTSATRPRQHGKPLRLMSGAIAILALLALALLVTREFGDTPHPQSTGSLLALVLAAMVTGAGCTLLVWIVTTATKRANASPAEHPLEASSFYTPAAGIHTGTEASLLRTLTLKGYWADSPDGVIRQIEPATDDSQTRLRELLGKTRKIIAADDRSLDAVARLNEAVRARKPYRELLWRCRLSGGQVLNLRESGTPRFSPEGDFLGYHGLIEDISSHSLDPLRSQLVTQALDVLPIPLALLHGEADGNNNTDWQLVWANTPMANLTGRSLVELGEMKVHHWMLCTPTPRIDGLVSPQPNRNRTGPLLSFLLEESSSHIGDGLIVDRHGRRRAVQLTIESIDAAHPGNRLFLVVADPDAAILKNLESRVAEVSHAQALAARRQLENDITARELESFSHTVSHDLRHPLRIVDGFARILQEDYGQLYDRTGNEHLNRILGASHRMSTMIDALVDLHGISSQPIAEDPVDLSALAQSIVDDLRNSEPHRKIQVAIDPRLSCRGDRVLLRMAMFNLIENAWKYTSKTDKAMIRIDSVLLHDSRVFRVTDNGAGFDKRFADRLFTLFHRLHGQTEFKGSGVGLATVQRIVRRHGGRIWADSAPDKGASFQFTLWDDAPDTLDSLDNLPVLKN